MSESKSPEISVVAGSPTAEELAAIVTVVAAMRSATPPPDPATQPRAGGWRTYWRTVRSPIHHGPGAWRTVAY